MEKEELIGVIDELNSNIDYKEVIDNAIGTMMLDLVSAKKLMEFIKSMPILIREAIYWNKFYMFVKGIKRVEDDLGKSIRLSNKLFDNPKNRKRNGMRLLAYVDKADSEEKINYYINATRSLLMGSIDNGEYFRIIKAIVETLNEDLEYLSKIAINSNVIKGNIQILALEQSGLVLQAGIDANESIETQNYTISTLGRMVDEYAISLENEERQKFYKKEMEQCTLEVELHTISNDEIDNALK